ncbi:MAG: hypothetical protein AAF236_02860 [Verrucomicrobiota bacterium]
MNHSAVALSADSGALQDDSFMAMPRNCDTAVVYWNLSTERQPASATNRLCLMVRSDDSEAEEMIILHRESGHFIIPLLAEARNYEISLGWSNASGFRSLFTEQVKLPDHPESVEGAMSSSLSFRGAHFWPKGYGASVN